MEIPAPGAMIITFLDDELGGSENPAPPSATSTHAAALIQLQRNRLGETFHRKREVLR